MIPLDIEHDNLSLFDYALAIPFNVVNNVPSYTYYVQSHLYWTVDY